MAIICMFVVYKLSTLTCSKMARPDGSI